MRIRLLKSEIPTELLAEHDIPDSMTPLVGDYVDTAEGVFLVSARMWGTSFDYPCLILYGKIIGPSPPKLKPGEKGYSQDEITKILSGAKQE